MLHAWTRLRIVSYLYAASAAASIARRFQSKQNGERKLCILVPINYWLQVRGCWNALQNETKNSSLFFAGDFLRIAVLIVASVPRSAHNKIDNYDVQLV
jgi:hypothetical protein